MSTGGSGRAGRPLRRDAERNRVRIVAAARELVAARGLGVSYEEIARHADVAVGTVYNRFPCRDDLVDAVFAEQLAEVVLLAEAALERGDPWEALVAFMTATVAMQAEDRGLRELSAGTTHRSVLMARARAQIAPVVAQLVARAQHAGVLRAEVTEADLALVPVMVGAVIEATRPREQDLWRRCLALVMDGLRPTPGPPLPDPPPSADSAIGVLGGPGPAPGGDRPGGDG